jgi:excisionase family DNA binding protein
MKDRSLSNLTVLQAAHELNVSVHTIRAWIARRRLGYRKLGRSVRVPAEEVQRLLEQTFVPARPERGKL